MTTTHPNAGKVVGLVRHLNAGITQTGTLDVTALRQLVTYATAIVDLPNALALDVTDFVTAPK